ncbi:MAG: lysophospholipid acyltransferase family protein [Proteobacteria bacterium]|nr:lysophospholipid acyltransferase family protein [Pseudomonadota bacterium]
MTRDTEYDRFKKRKSTSLKEVRHFAEYVVLVVLQKFAGLWSFRMNQRIGAWFGKLSFHLARKDRGIAQYQLDFCFPELTSEQKEHLLKETFINTGIVFFETLIANKIRENPRQWITLENAEVVYEALAAGNGAVLLFGHVGNWELLTAVYEMLDIQGIAVESPIGDSKLGELLSSIRKSRNITMIPRGDKKSARSILSCFRNNETFLFAIDQDTRVKTVFVDFFGKPAATAIGAATFAQRFNAPVLAAFGARMEDGTHRYFFEALSQAPYKGGDGEIKVLTRMYNQALEKHIRRFPSQWVWFHRRWKNQPDEETR